MECEGEIHEVIIHARLGLIFYDHYLTADALAFEGCFVPVEESAGCHLLARWWTRTGVWLSDTEICYDGEVDPEEDGSADVVLTLSTSKGAAVGGPRPESMERGVILVGSVNAAYLLSRVIRWSEKDAKFIWRPLTPRRNRSSM